MAAKSILGAAEIAADWVFHFLEEMGEYEDACVQSASDVYKAISGQKMNVEDILGIEGYDD